MAERLDLTGLSYLWGKIKAKFATKDVATTSVAGLMSATDKTKLNGIATGAQVNSITGVKGNAESSYRTGDVNLTPANIGAMDEFAMFEYGTDIPIPAQGLTARYDVSGMNDSYNLVRWNFSASPENSPPANLTWATYNGYFTITNNGGVTNESIQPIFVSPILMLGI